jgi:hypothetical protein
MRFAKAAIVTVGLAGAFALGLRLGPALNDVNAVAAGTQVTASNIVWGDGLPVDPAEVVRASRPARVVPVSSESVIKQVKLLLNEGTDVEVASEGFRDAEQLMTVAYLAHNTEIPFVVLKHRVLAERRSLAAAIREFKPALDEVAEVNRARAEARADLARM